MKKIIPIGESRTISGQGEYLYIASSTGPVLVVVENTSGNRSSHDVNTRFQLRVNGGIRSVELLNKHTAINTVDVETGIGEFMPSNDGQKVTLTGQDVSIQVVTDPLFPLDVQGPMTDAEMRATPVPVSGPLTDAELRATPVPVESITPATLVSGAVITGSATIPANPLRRFLIIKGLTANTGIGWTGAVNTGDAIEKGERVIYETTDAVTITATVAIDQFAWAEVEQ